MKKLILLFLISLPTFINSQNVGINNPDPQAALDLKGDLRLRSETLSGLINSTNNDVNISTIKSSVYKFDPTLDGCLISGFTGGVDGRTITIFNNTTDVVQLIDDSNASNGSMNVNRILTGSSSTAVIWINGSVTLRYDGSKMRWTIISSNYTDGLSTSPPSTSPWNVSMNDISNNNSGNVGIGTSSAPTSKLEVINSIPSATTITGKASGSNGIGVYGRAESNGIGIFGESYTGNAIGGYFIADGSGNEKALKAETFNGGTAGYFNSPTGNALITNQGKVGIGEPIPQEKLHVSNGNVKIGKNASWASTADNSQLKFGDGNFVSIGEVGGDDKMEIKAAQISLITDKVGIGEPIPQEKLHVSNGNVKIGKNINWTSTADNSQLKFGDGSFVSIGEVGGDDKMEIKAAQISLTTDNVIIPTAKVAIGTGTASVVNKIQIGNPPGFAGNDIAIGNGTQAMSLFQSPTASTFFTNTNFAFMPASGLGRVGIGTTAPEAPLHVIGNASVTANNFAFYARRFESSDGYYYLNSGIASSPIDVSIYASNRVLASEFNAQSDARHKNITNRNDNALALSKLLKLTPTNYKFIDTVTKGNQEKLGFIAQEVESVLPLAVSKTNDYIPNIFAMAKSFSYENEAKTLTIHLENEHEFELNDEVKIITEGTEIGKIIKVIGKKTFIMDNIKKKPEGVFVFGKKVNDFRVVDYDHIFTLGISAIQQLAKENEALKNKITTIESRFDKLEASLKNNLPITSDSN